MKYALLLLFAAPLLAQETGGASGADLARLFPQDTFLWVEADAGAVEAGLAEWQVAKILADPALKTFLTPAFRQLGIDPDKPVESLLAQAPLKQLFEGRVALGVRGLSTVVKDGMGGEWRFEMAPEAPLDARAVFRCIGMMSAFDAKHVQKVTIDVDIDFLAVGRPGPLGKEAALSALDALEGNVVREAVKVGGHDATHVRSEVDIGWGMSHVYNFYAAEQGGTWYLAGRQETLGQALDGGPRASYAANPALAQARARFTGGRPALLVYVDLGLVAGAYKAFIPPIAGQMADISGLGSIRGIGLGMSLVDGGLRESIGIVLDGNPRGVWKLLDAMPGGLRSLEVGPPGALAAFGAKLDLTILRDRARALLADVLPGNEDLIERDLVSELGFDPVTELLPALGDEVGLLVYPPGPNEIVPRFVLGIDGRDEAALAKLVAKVQEQIPAEVARFTPVDLGGIPAVRVASAVPCDMHFAVHKRHFFLASGGGVLADVLTRWGASGSTSLLRDDPVLPAVLKATNGGDAGNLAMLGYVNLRACATEAMKAFPLWGQMIPADWFDAKGAGGLGRIPSHLTGVAIALRHDKNGLTLDAFSPVGVLVPSVVAAVALWTREREIRVVQAQQAFGPNPRKASLGINQKSRDGAAVKVLGLVPNGPAATAGFRQGDRIVAFDGVAVASIEDLQRELGRKSPGDSVEVKIRRGDEEVMLTVELGDEAELATQQGVPDK